MARKRLEGPKMHHDPHGSHASVPGKGNKMAVPNEHWEKEYRQYDPSKNMKATEGSDFCAKPSSKRKTTHLKVNDTDH